MEPVNFPFLTKDAAGVDTAASSPRSTQPSLLLLPVLLVEVGVEVGEDFGFCSDAFRWVLDSMGLVSFAGLGADWLLPGTATLVASFANGSAPRLCTRWLPIAK